MLRNMGGVVAACRPTQLACRVVVTKEHQHFALVSKMRFDGCDTQAAAGVLVPADTSYS